MVLGLGKKGNPVVSAFEIALHEVKPWPSRTLPRTVMIHWQRGEKRTGHTKCVSGDKDRIIINDLLMIPATLYKLHDKKRGSPRFHKKCVVLSLCEAEEPGIPRGQPLGRAVLDLADFGDLKEQSTNAVSSIPVAVARKEFSSLGTPYLSFTITPQGLTSSHNSNTVGKEKEDNASPIASLVSDEDEDMASFTDEDDNQDSGEEKGHQLSDSSSPTVLPFEAIPVKNERVRRILSSTAASPSFSPAPSASSSFAAAAAAAAASTYASKRKPSFGIDRPKHESKWIPEVPVAALNSEQNKAAKANSFNNVLQAARKKYADGAGERSERLEKKAVEEARQRADAAEVKATSAQQESKKLKDEVDILKSELREAAALELALYSAVAQHGSSSHKIHAPARRLARIYNHASKNSKRRTVASTARSCASGLVVVVRACENDVSRLTFWWSNVAVLREMISHAPTAAEPPSSNTDLHDWAETSTLVSTLERIEAWIFGRIVECIWWQSLTPHMQSSGAALDQAIMLSSPRSVVSRFKKSMRGLMTTSFEEPHQGLLSIEIWKAAFLDALQRICPVRAGGHDCGCLQIVGRMIVEQCVARLDVAMFNAILRDMEESIPTDPISDPIMDLSVLPIQPDGVSFGGGVQLKNVINTWSTWLLTLTASAGDEAAAAAAQENVEKGTSHFTLLRAMSDLLMLPKDMLMDKSVRKEVCPALSLLLIRRILSKFVPDEYAPDPVPPSLLAALNAEISMEKQRVGEEDISPRTVIMASAPPVVYFPPSAAYMCDDKMTSPTLARSTSIFRKGHNSDDELEELESPLFLLVENGCIDGGEAARLSSEGVLAERYRLLRNIWN